MAGDIFEDFAALLAQQGAPSSPGGRAGQVPLRSSTQPNAGARNATASGRTSYRNIATTNQPAAGPAPMNATERAAQVQRNTGMGEGSDRRFGHIQGIRANQASSAPASAAGGAGGSGGGGGGGAGVAGLVSGELGTAGVLKAQEHAAAEKAALEGQYEADKAELAELYQFAETPDEKARIAKVLADLERQRNEGLAAIEIGYASARNAVQGRADTARDASGQEALDVLDLYTRASGAAASDSELEGLDAGGGLGALQGGTTGNDAYAQYIQQVAGPEAALSLRLGNINAEDIDWLADTLVGESKAQQGDLTRLAMAMTGDAQNRHDERVSDRINTERLAFADQTGRLQGDFRGRGWDLGDQERELMMRLEEIRAENARANAAARSRAASGGRGGRSRSGGGGGLGIGQDTQLGLAVGNLMGAGPGFFADILANDPVAGRFVPREARASVQRESVNNALNGASTIARAIGGFASKFL